MDHQVRVFLACRPLIQAHIRSLVREAKLKVYPDEAMAPGGS